MRIRRVRPRTLSRLALPLVVLLYMGGALPAAEGQRAGQVLLDDDAAVTTGEALAPLPDSYDELQARRTAVNQELLEVEQAHQALRADIRDLHRNIYQQSVSVESDDPELRDLRARLQEHEREAAALREELQRRLVASPEAQEKVAARAEAMKKVTELKARKRELVSERWRLNNKLSSLDAAKKASEEEAMRADETKAEAEALTADPEVQP